MTFRHLAAVVLANLLAPVAILAHHGYEDFDKERRVTIEGVVEDVQYSNPHVTLKVRTDAGELYTALWERIGGVERRGGSRTTVVVGDRIKVVGCPPKDPASHDVAMLRQVTRLRDGWTWRTE